MRLSCALFGAAAAAAVMLAGGCHGYPNPPADYMGDSYSQRTRTEADELLKGISLLSLSQAQDIAVANNPSYVAAYYSINAARMRYYQALGAYSPEINASFGMDFNANRRYNDHSLGNGSYKKGYSLSTNTGLEASWLVFNGLGRYFETRIAELGVKNQQALTEDECRLLIRGVAYAYNNVLLAVEEMRIAAEDRIFQQKNLYDTELKYQAGAVPLSEVLNFQNNSNQATASYIDAEYKYEIAVEALAVLMGYPEGILPPEIKFPEISSDIQLDDIPGVEIYLDNALANRPDLRSFREQLKISEYSLYSAYSRYSPVVYASAGVNFNTDASRSYNYTGSSVINSNGTTFIPNGTTSSRDYRNTPSFSMGVTANWTIFNGFIRLNQVREAQALLAASKYQVADQWLRVVEEVRAAHVNYTQNVRKTKLYKQTLAIATKQRDLVEEEYKAGNTELTRLNQAQLDLVDAQTALAQSYITVQNAKAQLDAAAAMNAADYSRKPDVFLTEDEKAAKEVQLTPAEEFARKQAEAEKADAPEAQARENARKTAKAVSESIAPAASSSQVKSDAKPEVKAAPAAPASGKAPAWNPDNLAI